ncbi:HEAT repeat domain-containing protein [Natronobiforma cellulositropha]|uniref:HEAT repeat domain-containing protein n=1 Tax=Natronobiforma cellulositropha TaxID=1679076 RepID=UPI0021D5B4C4|nr:HEAT repeat domain-containing protein [Natronobiforma cellulositropha]
MSESVSFDSIREGLRSDDFDDQQEALYELFEAATEAEDWSQFEPLVEDLESVLDADPYVREGAINALYRLDVLSVDHVQRLDEIVQGDDSRLGFRTVDVLFERSKQEPEAVVPIASSMIDFLVIRDWLAEDASDETPGSELREEDGVEIVEHSSPRGKQLHAARRFKADTLLSTVAEREPAALVPKIDEFVATAGRDDYDDLRSRILETATLVAETHAEECEAAIEPAADVVATTENAKIRTKATYLLAMVAEAHLETVAETVEPHLETLFEMLESVYSDEQNAAISLLSYVAEVRPEEVDAARDQIVTLLDHHIEGVRGSAIWTLEYIGDESVVADLDAVAESDPNEDIRDLAAEASASLTAD